MMKLHRAHKIRLTPTKTQVSYMQKACGTARFAYNWALVEWNRMYEACKADPDGCEKPSAFGLNKRLNAIKKSEFPWMYEVTSQATMNPILNLGDAFARFFKGQNNRPRFKKKGKSRDSFKIVGQKVKVDGKYIRVEKLGWVEMTQELRFEGKIVNATISRTADKWFVSILVETETPEYQPPTSDVVGVDLGCTDLAALSDGRKIKNPKAYRANLTRLKRLQRSLSRKKKGSNNRRKAQMKLARQHYKIACIRKDNIHKLTSMLVKEHQTIVIEDLNVKGMVKNHNLAMSVSDASFGEIRSQLEYKAEWYGRKLIVADRWFASSKLCSCCGEKNKALTLKIREWTCASCGTQHDRDTNAAINLRNLAVGTTVTACGEEGSGDGSELFVKPASVKQEDVALVA